MDKFTTYYKLFKAALISLPLFLISQNSSADALGLRVSAGAWDYSPSGDIRNSPNASDTFNLQSDLGIEDQTSFEGFVYFEHPIPIIPNFRFGVTELKLTGTGNTTTNKSWDGIPIDAGGVNTDIDLSHTELGLYYELWDTGFDFDLGVNVKFFDGTVKLQDSSSNTANTSFNETVPMLYGHFGVPLPVGFSIQGDISWISYDSNTFSDYLISVGWTSNYMIGVELGYRKMAVDYSDGDEYADVTIDGPYLNATLKF